MKQKERQGKYSIKKAKKKNVSQRYIQENVSYPLGKREKIDKKTETDICLGNRDSIRNLINTSQ